MCSRNAYLRFIRMFISVLVLENRFCTLLVITWFCSVPVVPRIALLLAHPLQIE